MRAIDADRLQKRFDEKSTNPNYRVNMHNIKSIISNAPTVEAIPKADYEARLKADMVAMLEELKSEYEEKIQGYEARSLEHINATYEASMCGRMFGYCGAKESIQEKIDKLKGEEDGTNDKTSD